MASADAGSGRRVTSENLAISPSVVGRLLAEPWRRLAAMVLDLAGVGLLSLLSSPWLGLATGVMLLLLFGNSPQAPFAQIGIRWVCRLLGVVVIVLSALALGHSSFVRQKGLNLTVLTGERPGAVRTESIWVAPDASPRQLRDAVDQLTDQNKALAEENRELRMASTSWTYQSRSFANALGVTFGWSGVYFTLIAGSLGGRTLGKLMLGARAVRIDGKAFTFFDAFLRHGGYVAGVAMGMMGFLKILWEPNRQAVEDRIAATVVIRGSAP